MKKVLNLELPNGKEPFREWIKELDSRSRARIYVLILRVAARGSRKNVKSLGDGVFEIKMKFGPGYRIYFCDIDKAIILLLLGGDKNTQERDVKQAKEFRRKYV